MQHSLSYQKIIAYPSLGKSRTLDWKGLFNSSVSKSNTYVEMSTFAPNAKPDCLAATHRFTYGMRHS